MVLQSDGGGVGSGRIRGPGGRLRNGTCAVKTAFAFLVKWPVSQGHIHHSPSGGAKEGDHHLPGRAVPGESFPEDQKGPLASTRSPGRGHPSRGHSLCRHGVCSLEQF